MNMSSKLIIIAALSASILGSACGDDPCLPTVIADTSIIPAAEMCTTGEPMGGSASSGVATGPACEPQVVVDPPVCIADPSHGSQWGACLFGNVCNLGLICHQGQVGSVCVSQCDECGCVGADNCIGGTCTDADECVPKCVAAGDACPLNMECDPGLGMCVRPGGSDACTIAIGKMWGPCDAGACEAGAECIFFATADICAPTCLGLGTTCDADECGPQFAIATCNPVDGHDGGLCTQECMSDIDCAAGQSCTEQGCLWLK